MEFAAASKEEILSREEIIVSIARYGLDLYFYILDDKIN